MRQHPSRRALILPIFIVAAAWTCSAIYYWIGVGPTAISGVSPVTSTAKVTPAASPTRRSGAATPVPGYATTWMGNSFRGGYYSDPGVPASKMHVQQGASDITVTSAGVAVLNHYWDEGHMYVGMYQNGRIVGNADCHGIPRAGWNGWSITNNGTHIYAIQNSGPNSPYQYINYLGRWNLDGTASTFRGAVSVWPGSTLGTCNNIIIVDHSPTGTDWPWGLAASSNEVFVADPAVNKIAVYDANTMALKRSWGFTSPRRIAYDPNTATLWISSGTKTRNQVFHGNIYHQDLNGHALSGTITTVAQPSGLTVHSGNLYVTDDGPDQNIKIFNSSGLLIGKFGDVGGYLSGTPGIMGATKLYRPNGIGFDGSSNFYVLGGGASDANTYAPNNHLWSVDLRSYNKGGALQWDIAAPGSWDDNATVDPASEGDFYSALNHYKFDYSKLTLGAGGGGREWSWYGSTFDPIHYPYDPRQYLYFPNIVGTSGVVNVGGNKFLAVTDQYSHTLVLNHFVGEIAKPMVVFSGSIGGDWPNRPAGSWIWQDTNNNGSPDAGEFSAVGLNINSAKWWYVDSAGDVWLSPGITRFMMQGINGNGQLTYSASAYTSYGNPAPFTAVQALQYDRADDVMYVSGFTAANPIGNGNGEDPARTAGTVIARYNNWLAGNRTAAWTALLPHVSSATWGDSIFPIAWSVAGNKIFVGIQMTQGTGSSNPTLYNYVTHNVYVYDATNGNSLGEMQPGPETNNYMGWIDQIEDLSAFQRSNGEYVVTEEEQVGAKVTVLRGMLNNFTQY